MIFGWFRQSFATLREKARRAFGAGDFARAIQLYQDALARGAREPEAAREEVQACLDASKNSLARVNLQKARELFSQGLCEEAEGLAELALSFAQEQELQQEIQTFADSLSLTEEEEGFQEEEQEEAREAFWEAHIERSPASLHSSYRRLAARSPDPLFVARNKEPAEALGVLDPLVETEPAARYERALCRLALQEMGSVIVDFEHLLSSIEDDPALYRAAASAYTARAVPGGIQNVVGNELPPLQQAAKEDLEQAAEHLTSALELSPQDGDLYAELIEALFLLKQLDRARRAAEVGLRRVQEPRQRCRVLVGLARTEIAAGRSREAEAALEQAVALPSEEQRTDPEAVLLLLWLLLEEQSHLERALLLTAELKRDPEQENQWWGLFYEGQIFQSLEKPEEARSCWEAARRLAKPRSFEEEEIDKALRLLNGTASSPYR